MDEQEKLSRADGVRSLEALIDAGDYSGAFAFVKMHPEALSALQNLPKVFGLYVGLYLSDDPDTREAAISYRNLSLEIMQAALSKKQYRNLRESYDMLAMLRPSISDEDNGKLIDAALDDSDVNVKR